MTIFDLLFLLAILSSAVTLSLAATFLVRRRSLQALKVLKIYALCVFMYFIAGLAVSFFTPQRLIAIREPWCFDDWCLSAEDVTQIRQSAGTVVLVKLQISSRAGRVAQRANGAWIYLLDDRGQLISPDQDPSIAPLDLVLQPLESVTTSRAFHLQTGAHPVGLITGHGGRYCGTMSFLVIGGCGCLFRKPTMIAIQ